MAGNGKKAEPLAYNPFGSFRYSVHYFGYPPIGSVGLDRVR